MTKQNKTKKIDMLKAFNKYVISQKQYDSKYYTHDIVIKLNDKFNYKKYNYYAKFLLNSYITDFYYSINLNYNDYTKTLNITYYTD